MRFVVDASVAVKWLISEDGSDLARKLMASGEDLHAPRLMASEIANALWRKVRLGEVKRADAASMLAWIPEMPVHWHADETVSADAGRLALALNHPVYDCVYLALAHRIGATMVTADGRFATALGPSEHGGAIVTLESYARTR